MARTKSARRPAGTDRTVRICVRQQKAVHPSGEGSWAPVDATGAICPKANPLIARIGWSLENVWPALGHQPEPRMDTFFRGLRDGQTPTLALRAGGSRQSIGKDRKVVAGKATHKRGGLSVRELNLISFMCRTQWRQQRLTPKRPGWLDHILEGAPGSRPGAAGEAA